MPACIYCGEDAGEFDEHDACVEASLEAAVGTALEDAEAGDVVRIDLETPAQAAGRILRGEA